MTGRCPRVRSTRAKADPSNVLAVQQPACYARAVFREPTLPCYLFTYHAYGSWMPDRNRGYVKRKNGVLPADHDMARRYRDNATFTPVKLEHAHQRVLIDTSLVAADATDCTLQQAATDDSHLHVLWTWNDERTWQSRRRSLKTALTLQMKATFGPRPWLTENASRKRVKDRAHYDYLISQYLPGHRGWKWCPRGGWFR